MILDKQLGKVITLVGTAYDAKAGAMILTENESAVYIRGLDEWPGQYSGKKISVSGLLTKDKLVPDPVIGRDGGISTGAYGEDYVLDNAEYKLMGI